MSLRWLLVIIGILIIAAVYFLTAAKRRRDARVSFDRRFTTLDVPDVILQHEEDDDEGSLATPAADARPRLPDNVVLSDDQVGPEDLPQVMNTLAPDDEPGNERARSDQLDLFGAAGDERRRTPAPATPQAAPAAATPPVEVQPDDGLIKLFVRARGDQEFAGPAVVRTFNTVGMNHGEMSIFHHFGAGELRSDEAIFSAANLFEPGTFDLSRIEAFRTSGIVLFMQLPTALDGAVAFELLLNTAQRLAELLDGELCATPRAPLDPRNIADLRRRAGQFASTGG